jgi:hypothetical protein
MKTESLRYEKAAQKCRPFNVFNHEYNSLRIGVQWAPILCPGGTEVNFVPSGDEVMLFSNGYSLP